MRILLFEWLTGGGLWTDGQIPDNRCPVQEQGAAMLAAFAGDLLAGGVEVVVPMDLRLSIGGLAEAETIPIDSAGCLQRSLIERAGSVDAIMIIAPETNGCLRRCCVDLERFREKLVSPKLEFVELAADKNATARWLTKKGIPVPSGGALDEIDVVANPPELPMVMKPTWGAGSEDVQLIEDWHSFCLPSNLQAWRVENFVPGVPVSVSVLCGQDECRLLHPTGQTFDGSPFGNYSGGSFPLAPEIAQRATRLASRTIAELPQTQGYIGIDMVIAANGQAYDCVVDINPRLTTSYLTLREIYEENLAIATLRIARG
jgi:predicted ATP-grasp superfamily ATP-dependent carboligase